MISTVIEPTDFRRMFFISAGLHFVFFALFTINAVLFPVEPMRLVDAVRVDLVGLPDHRRNISPEPVELAPSDPTTLPALPSNIEHVPAIPQQKKRDDIKDQQSAALKRIEALNKVKKMVDTDKARPVGGALSPRPIKGNIASKGSSLTGVIKLDHQEYLGNVKAKIKENWNLPKWLRSTDLKARVHIYINPDGTIAQKVIVQSSGEKTFDERVLASVEQSSPLPKPPSTIASLLQIEGIEVRFPD